MATDQQLDFLRFAKQGAIKAGHPFPGAAAAEAAVESKWGQSVSALRHHNILGIKPPSWWHGIKFWLPTDEYLGEHGKPPASWHSARQKLNPDGSWKIGWWVYQAEWAHFDTIVECFQCQIEIFKRDADYAGLLDSPTAEAYVVHESRIYSSGPERAQVVLKTYNAHKDILT